MHLQSLQIKRENRLVGSKLRKALQSGNLLVVQQAAEHEVSSTRMLALMKNLEKLQDEGW